MAHVEHHHLGRRRKGLVIRKARDEEMNFVLAKTFIPKRGNNYRPPNVLARRGELSARRLAPGGRWDERSLK